MPVPTIDLDTRRYPDLVDEARALIPRYAPTWTDHNASDPGITLVELFAFLGEQLLFRANRTPERHRRKFLSLLGCDPRPPQPAQTVVTIQPIDAADGVVLPAGLGLATGATPFCTASALTLSAARLAAVQCERAGAIADVSARLRAGAAVAPFGEDPSSADGPALLLGFDGALPAGRELSLYVVAGVEGDSREAHHSVRTVWEVHDGAAWVALAAADIRDDTRGLTVDGRVVLTLPMAAGAVALGDAPDALRYVRCRLAAGVPDATPRLHAVVANAVVVDQRAPAVQCFPIVAGTPAPAVAPVPGTRAALDLRLDERGAITSFAASGVAGPEVLVLDYVAATAANDGELTLTCAQVRRGGGAPGGVALADGGATAGGAITLWSLEADGPHGWTAAVDLDAAGPDDQQFVLDAGSGVIRFGDGRRGRTVPAAAPLLATYDTTLGAAGNVPAADTWRVLDDARNAAVLGTPPVAAQALIASAASPRAARGGADAETVAQAAGRAAARLWSHERLMQLAGDNGVATLDEADRDAVLALPAPPRATTLLDLERIALDVPGTTVARARAFGGVDGEHPGLRAPGTVTAVVVNSVPRRRPVPSPQLLTRVRAHLVQRKTLGTRLVVCGPTYVEVDVAATLRLRRGARAERVRDAAAERVTAYLDPLSGGPAGRGRAFGRDVYRSEMLELLDGVDGVEHVTQLTLRTSRGDTCANVCIPDTGLAVAGTITIEVAP